MGSDAELAASRKAQEALRATIRQLEKQLASLQSELLASGKGNDAELAAAKKACYGMEKQVEALRAELAASGHGNDAQLEASRRAEEALRATIRQLEKQLASLQAELLASGMGNDAELAAAIARARQLQQELDYVNAELSAVVAKAAAHDSCAGQIIHLEELIQRLQEQLGIAEARVAELNSRVTELTISRSRERSSSIPVYTPPREVHYPVTPAVYYTPVSPVRSYTPSALGATIVIKQVVMINARIGCREWARKCAGAMLLRGEMRWSKFKNLMILGHEAHAGGLAMFC